MRCKAAKSLISRSFDEPIREYDRSRLEEHVQECPDCATHVRVLERGRSLLHTASQQGPSENFEWKVQLAIQRALREKARGEYGLGRRSSFWRPLLTSSVAVAAAVVTLGLLFLPQRGSQSEPSAPDSGFAASGPDLSGGHPIEIYDPLYVSERGGRYVSDGGSTPVGNSVLPWTERESGQDAMLEELRYLRRLALQQQDQILHLQAMRSGPTLASMPDTGSVRAPR